MTSRNSSSRSKFLLGAMIFTAAYLTTITVNAQETQATGDAIQLNENGSSVITGTIKDADENWVLIDSAGKDIRINLDRVELKDEADEIFTKGMMVTVDGEMEGNDFGVPVVDARSITATEAPGTQYYQDRVVP